MGCDCGQGYLFDRPLEASVMLERIRPESLPVPVAGRLPIFYVIYVSEASIPVDAAIVAAIKQQSANNNRQVAVTGLLIHQGGCFMQMLEGEEQRVRWLMERIRLDPRHRRVRTVIEGASNRRCFASWSMGVRDLAQLERRPEFSVLPQSRGLMTLAEDPQLCYDYFRAFAERG
jgi:hypothetical protein